LACVDELDERYNFLIVFWCGEEGKWYGLMISIIVAIILPELKSCVTHISMSFSSALGFSNQNNQYMNRMINGASGVMNEMEKRGIRFLQRRGSPSPRTRSLPVISMASYSSP